MGWSGGGSVSVDNKTIKENVQGEIYVVPNTSEAVNTSSSGVGATVDGSTIKINTSNQITAGSIPLANIVGDFSATVPATYSNGVFAVSYDDATITLNASDQLQINLANANTWTGVQTFGNNISIGGYQLDVSSPTSNQALMFNGTNWVNQTVVVSVTDEAKAVATKLTATTATTIATFTPSSAGNYVLYAYFTVITATTTVTLEATWTDTSGSQSYTWVNAGSEAVGSYTLMPLYINSVASDAITITATAGTADQVYVSANIVNMD